MIKVGYSSRGRENRADQNRLYNVEVIQKEPLLTARRAELTDLDTFLIRDKVGMMKVESPLRCGRIRDVSSLDGLTNTQKEINLKEKMQLWNKNSIQRLFSIVNWNLNKKGNQTQ